MGAKMKRKSKCRQDALARALYDSVIAFWASGSAVTPDHPYYPAYHAYVAVYPSDAPGVYPRYHAGAILRRAWEATHGKAP